MTDVFVSYSRRDSEFVRRLAESVVARGKEVWVDTAGIADGEVFPEAIKRAIEQSDAFLFVITPASVASAYCEHEVEYARELQKRIVPVLRDPVGDDELPAEIRDRNWIPFTEADEFEGSLARLVTALDTDLEAAKAHTRWLLKALEWDGERRDRSFLLRGSELKAAEVWLAASPEDADPAPTALQREYLLASRESAAKRQRLLVGASLVIAAVSIGLLIFALISRSQAVSTQVGASAQALAAESQAELPNDAEISLILGDEAVRTRATPQTLFSLRAALDQSPFERAYATVGSPGSCGFNAGLTAVLSPDGDQIAEGACNGTLQLLDYGSGRVLHRLRTSSGIVSLAYSPNGSLLAVGTERQIMLVNPSTGAVVRERSGLTGTVVAQSAAPGVAGLVFSPDGRELATADTVHLELWSVPTLKPRTLATYPAVGNSMVFSHNGRELIVGGTYDNALRVYDASSGRLLRTVDLASASQGSGYTLLALSPDGSHLAAAYGDENGNIDKVSLFDTSTWTRQFDVTSIPYVEISALDFSPNGSELAVGAENGTARVWSLLTREMVAAYAGPTAAIGSMVFTPNGRSVLTASNDGTVRLWRALGVESALVPIHADLGSVGLSGNTLLVAGSVLGKSWLYRYRLSPTPRLLASRYIGLSDTVAGALSANGAVGVTYRAPNQQTGAPAAGRLRIYDVAAERVVRSVPNLAVENAVLSRNGSLLFLQLQRLTLRRPRRGAGPPPGPPPSAAPTFEIMNTVTGRVVALHYTMPCGATPRSIAFSADGGRVATGEFCGAVEVWNARSGRLVRQFNENAELSSVDLNSNGSRVLVGSWDSRATIWNVANGSALQLIGHTSGINSAVFAGDDLVVTASLDDTVRVWDARSGAELRVLDFSAEQGTIVTSRDGQEMALAETTLTPDTDNAVRIFATCPACEDAKALLRQAAPRIPPTRALSVLEKTVVEQAKQS